MKRVIGIGNALVDIMVKIPGEELLKEFNMPKGSMQLVDAERSEQVKRGTGNLARSVSSGGSVANTIHALAILGARPGYIGSTGTDELGEYFVNDLLAAGADPVIFRRSCATGTAVALVTPDSERTFATYLGAAVDLNSAEISDGLLEGYDILYIEGYLITSFELVESLCRTAKSLGMEVALDLSSFNVVEAFREQFSKITREYVDILFANEEEAKALTGLDAEEAVSALSEFCRITVVKTGCRGSLIRRGAEILRIGVIPVKPVDTTGAGDMYAAGFLYCYCKDEPLDQCGAFGALLAGSVIEHIGAKLPSEKWSEIKTILNQ